MDTVRCRTDSKPTGDVSREVLPKRYKKTDEDNNFLDVPGCSNDKFTERSLGGNRTLKNGVSLLLARFLWIPKELWTETNPLERNLAIRKGWVILG